MLQKATESPGITEYHAKYYAYELTRQHRGGDIDRISQSLFDAAVDLNPRQIDGALEQRLHQKSSSSHLFRVRWQLH